MTIRVVLTGRESLPLVPPPGRVLLAHADHSFADLADAIDVAFARWDLTPLHEFAVEGRRLAAEPDEADIEDSDEVTVGEVGLRPGSRFIYLFDLAKRWTHDCTVQEVGVDPYELAGEEPDLPTAILGWGTIPDQHGRYTEYADEFEEAPEFDAFGDSGLFSDFDIEEEIAAWDEAEAASWEIVAKALAGVERPLPAQDLAMAAARIRAQASEPRWPYDVLLAAGGLEGAELPADDQQLWLELASGVVSPRDETPLDDELEASWYCLDLADWVGTVIGLVRSGVGHLAEPEELIRLIEICPEVEVEETDPDDVIILASAFETVVSLWEALGAVDSNRRLTPLGRWGLPEALRLAWTE